MSNSSQTCEGLSLSDEWRRLQTVFCILCTLYIESPLSLLCPSLPCSSSSSCRASSPLLSPRSWPGSLSSLSPEDSCLPLRTQFKQLSKHRPASTTFFSIVCLSFPELCVSRSVLVCLYLFSSLHYELLRARNVSV